MIRFGAIPEDVWRGEAMSSAQAFREVHVRCLPHLDLHDGFEFVTLHFELVDVAPDPAAPARAHAGNALRTSARSEQDRARCL